MQNVNPHFENKLQFFVKKLKKAPVFAPMEQSGLFAVLRYQPVGNTANRLWLGRRYGNYGNYGNCGNCEY